MRRQHNCWIFIVVPALEYLLSPFPGKEKRRNQRPEVQARAVTEAEGPARAGTAAEAAARR